MARRNAPRDKRPINRLGDHMGDPHSGTSYDDTQFLQRGTTPVEQPPTPEQKRKPDKRRSVNDDQESKSKLQPMQNRKWLNKKKIKNTLRADQEAEKKETLREAMEEMQAGGSDVKLSHYITGFVMHQMTAKAGIKKHGKVAIEALYQEFLQLHDQTTFEGKHAHKLSAKEKAAALRAISVVKEKRDGRIKGRTVADG